MKIAQLPLLRCRLTQLAYIPQPRAATIPPTLRTDPLRTHFPVTSTNYIKEAITQGLPDKSLREIYVPKLKMHTNQFDERLTFEPLFPRHRLKDEATFELSIKKRIRLATPQQNQRELKDSNACGEALFEALQHGLKLHPTAWDAKLFDDCIIENEDNKLNAPLNKLKNDENRSDPIWPLSKIALFMKSQLCKKIEKLHSPAIAGQTLACFNNDILLTLGPLGRYLLKTITAQLPNNILIFSRLTPADLNDFILSQWDHNKLSTDDDFEQFDSSQNGQILAFELRLLQYFNVPAHLIELYRQAKINAHCFVGPLAILRLTGEWSTFLFNTLANIAFKNLKYIIRPGTPQVYAGDDSSINDVLQVRPSFRLWQRQLRLKSKQKIVQHPTFCGWRFSPHGLFKDPTILAARLLITLERDELHLCAKSYLVEHAFLYHLADTALSYLTPLEAEYAQFVTRTLIRHRHLIPHFQDIINSPPHALSKVYSELKRPTSTS